MRTFRPIAIVMRPEDASPTPEQDPLEQLAGVNEGRIVAIASYRSHLRAQRQALEQTHILLNSEQKLKHLRSMGYQYLMAEPGSGQGLLEELGILALPVQSALEGEVIALLNEATLSSTIHFWIPRTYFPGYTGH